MRRYTASEHEDLPFGTGDVRAFPSEAECLALHAAQARLPGTPPAIRLGHGYARTGSHVGVLRADGVELEILPKTANADGPTLRGTLVRMLALGEGVALHEGDTTRSALQDRTLLDVFIDLFAARLADELRRGQARRYQGRADDLARLRGKLDIPRQFTRFAGRTDVLACRYEEFTADIALNQVLLCAARHLARLSTRPATMRRLLAAAASFDGVTPVAPARALALAPRLDRLTRRWESPLRLARLLLRGLSQTVHGGGHRSIALLFDMNRLFEAYVGTLAERELAPDWRVGLQAHSTALTVDGAYPLRPDILVRNATATLVLDTKWKTGVTCPSASDTYQMHAYARAFAADATLLLYPVGAEAHGFARTRFRDGCQFGAEWLDVTDEAALRRHLRRTVEAVARRDAPVPATV